MKVLDCEAAMIAKMAEADGESFDIAAEQVERHFASCEACRSETEKMTDLGVDLSRLERHGEDVDLWPGVSSRISVAAAKPVGWWPFVLVGGLLLVYKLIELLLAQAPGLLLNLVPIAGLVVLFILIKENPFKIDPELTVEE